MMLIQLLVLSVLAFSAGTTAMSETSVEVKLKTASSAYLSGKYAESAKLIEEALLEVKQKAPLVIENFYLIRREAPHFGGFEPRGNDIYESAEPIYFYLEPNNVVFVKKGEVYTAGFWIDCILKDQKGEVLLEQKKFLDAEFNSRSPISDMFANINFDLSGAPAGTYNIEFTVRDQNSNKSAKVQKEVKIE
ncbi:MAG TPA: hypothetical protein VLB01_08380 [Thermodesulfobacteriota bacterium]|nr:hypothetical protein [Thermodesulfobacteriota bacterium]